MPVSLVLLNQYSWLTLESDAISLQLLQFLQSLPFISLLRREFMLQPARACQVKHPGHVLNSGSSLTAGMDK